MFNSLINQAKLKKETNPEQWQQAVNVQANKQDNIAGVKEGTAKHVVGQNTSAKTTTPQTTAPQTTTYTVNAGNEPYVQQLNALYDQIMNRKPFQYDLNSDLLYKNLADSYTQAGQKAMRDTMGTAAGLTGGYGNSYAQLVGNQAYQEHLTALNDQIPSLYEQALNAYLNEGNQMLQQYELAATHPGVVNAIKPQTYTVTQNSNDTLTDMQAVQNQIASGSVTGVAAGGTVAPTNNENWYYKILQQYKR